MSPGGAFPAGVTSWNYDDPDPENSPLFARLDILGFFRRSDGYFYFKLCYPRKENVFSFPSTSSICMGCFPEVHSECFRFKQLENPVEKVGLPATWNGIYSPYGGWYYFKVS